MIWIAPTEKDTATDTLEKRLWDAADQLRANSGLKAQEYFGPILGLIFLRFAEVRFTLSIRAQLEKLIRLNQTRTDFQQQFEELVESYNAGSRNIEALFEELVKLSRNLSEEQQRHVRENMTEEELVIFDILTRPAPELIADERREVKKVAKLLLERRALLVLDWRKRQNSRARVEDAIKDLLDAGLPRVYSPELYQKKCSTIYEHVYESYADQGENIYAAVN